jgi:hypothetical protein
MEGSGDGWATDCERRSSSTYEKLTKNGEPSIRVGRSQSTSISTINGRRTPNFFSEWSGMPRPNVPPAVANGDPGSGLQTAEGLDELARIMDATITNVTPTTNNQTQNTQQLAQAQVYNMRPKHENLQSLYNEWYGLGEFDDGRGGITGRDQLFGREWRLHKIHYKNTQD